MNTLGFPVNNSEKFNLRYYIVTIMRNLINSAWVIINRPLIKRMLQSIVFAILILPIMARDVSELKFKFTTGLVPLDVSYYQRVFNSNNSFLLGNFYIDSKNFLERSADFYSLGELIQRLGFKFLGGNVLVTYYIFSIVYLSFWIFLISYIATANRSQDNSRIMFATSILLIIFFSNQVKFIDSYPFARIINPQFSIVVWLLGALLLFEILRIDSSHKKSLRPYIWYGINLVVASLSYQFVFLALMASSAIAGLYILSKKNHLKSTYFLATVMISTIPYVVITLANRANSNYLDLLERLGLISSRLPGAAFTLIVIFSTLTILFMNQKRFLDPLMKIVNNVLVITSFGLIFASQSNIVTNMAIQFSDHFLVFAICNLVLVIVFVISKQEKFAKKYSLPKKIIIPTIVILMIFSIFKTLIPAIQYNHITKLHVELGSNFNSDTNVIVDTKISSTFPIYSGAKMLYQNDIYTYKYSNREILERYYISRGCPTNLNLSNSSPIIVYRIEAFRQKASALEKNLSILKLDDKLDFLYRPLQIKALNRELEISNELQNFLVKNRDKGCISLARSFNVDFVVFDEYSLWNKTLVGLEDHFNSVGDFTYIDIKEIDLKK
jgi:hypothetical protein